MGQMRRRYCWLGVVVMIITLLAWPAAPAAAQQPGGEAPSTRVVIVLLAPSPTTGGGIGAQADVVAQAQSDVLASVAPADFELIHRFEVVPGLVGVANAESLQALAKDPRVLAIAPDLPVYAALSESTTLINANRVWTEMGFTGAGVTMAVLDSGVDISHPDLADSIVAQHCFNHGTCPPNNTDESDSARDDNGHGTHVAGIITSRGAASPRGVAPDVGIVAVRVLNDAGAGWTSDVVAGIDWVVAHQAQYNIKVMNLSLGGGAYPDACDNSDANTMLYASAIQAARRAGIVAFAASGNGGYTNQMMTPACVNGVMAVGSTYDANVGPFSWGATAQSMCVDSDTAADMVTCTSNSSPVLDLLAPGATITSAALGGGSSVRSGTSMATPHASAVAALMLQARSGITPAEIESILKDTGVPTVDARNSRLTPRVDALAAVQRVTGAASPPAAGAVVGSVRLQNRGDHSSTSIFVSTSPCPLSPSVSPLAVTDGVGHFEVLATGQPYQCLQASHPGFLSAQRTTPQGSLGAVTLLGGDVNADQVIDIFDMAFMAGRYGGTDPACDINGDGSVDIFDLVIAAGNYEKRGPITDWQ
jgi:subtilisin